MSIPIFTNPGQNVTLVIQVVDGYGDRVDGYVPQVTQVLFPSLSAASGYPQNMSSIGTGLYGHVLAIPTGTSSLGTFIASVKWTDPSGNGVIWEIFQIQVALPFGNSSVTPL